MRHRISLVIYFQHCQFNQDKAQMQNFSVTISGKNKFYRIHLLRKRSRVYNTLQKNKGWNFEILYFTHDILFNWDNTENSCLKLVCMINV